MISLSTGKLRRKDCFGPIRICFLFQLLKLRKIRGKNWGKQDWWFDVTNNYLVQLIQTTNFTKHENQCHQFKV